MRGGAWCSPGHERAGIVSNQNLWDDERDKSGPMSSVATCDREECVRKGQRHVASHTNQAAVFYADPRNAYIGSTQ